MKPGGILLIDDWLSPYEDRRCDQIARVCAMEGLKLYPETQSHYLQMLTATGFDKLAVRNENTHYVAYNREIIERLGH